MDNETNINTTLDELATARGMEIVKKVNIAIKSSYIGVDELKDIVYLFYDLCELNEKRIGGQSLSIIELLGKILPGILPAIIGIDKVPIEASDLQDDEIKLLVDLANNYELGDNAYKYQQIIKIILVGIQSVYVFKS